MNTANIGKKKRKSVGHSNRADVVRAREEDERILRFFDGDAGGSRGVAAKLAGVSVSRVGGAVERRKKRSGGANPLRGLLAGVRAVASSWELVEDDGFPGEPSADQLRELANGFREAARMARRLAKNAEGEANR